MSQLRIKFFYAVPEYFPPWRLDVEHLFGHQLANMGLDITWSMWRDKLGSCQSIDWQGQLVLLPLSAGRNSRLARIVSRLTHAVCEWSPFLHLLVGKPFDVVQARDVRFIAAFTGWLAARLRGAKFTYWLSYPFPEHYLEWSKTCTGVGGMLRWLQGTTSFWFVYKWLMHRADHVFVQSEQMKRDVAAYGVPEAKMTPVPMAVPPKLLDWLAANPTKVVSGRVVYVGTMARVRRLETMIEAFAQVVTKHPDASFVMVGDGDVPSERGILEREVVRLGLADRVLFTGFIPMEDAWRYAASAQICVSPFFPTFVLRSTSPTKINEYLALGRPVVANDHPEQSLVIAESGAGLCVSWSAENFAAAIGELLSDSEACEYMGAKGPDWVRKNRTYDHVAKTVLHQYQKLIAEAD